MWTHHFEARSALAPDRLWPVLADVAGWPGIDATIASVRIDAAPEVGRQFVLRPRGGPPLRYTIGEFAAPRVYAGICRLPGAVMTTRHQLLPDGSGGTRMVIDIEIVGWMSGFWGLTIGRIQAGGLAAQSARFVAAAEAKGSAA